jgi:DHA3 family macrolide efflux protein-like MFS transporter
MQGRVFALVQSLATAATPLGMLIAGPVADALGVRVWYLIGGTACILMGVGGFFVPVVVHLEDDRAADQASEEGVAAPRTDPVVLGGGAE